MDKKTFKRLGMMIVFCLMLPLAQANAAKIAEIRVDGAIGPATADFIDRSIQSNQDKELIILLLDTPGGLELSTHSIVKAILSSKIPVVAYVYPDGARAASAGTMILYASTIAAMAPGTHLGAASPVNLLGMGSNEPHSTMDKKITNDTLANMRSLAQLRNRNIQFAENAVNDAQTLTASEALQQGVIEYIASSEEDLLQQLNGKLVKQNGKEFKLVTAGLEIQTIKPDWRMRFLVIITNPTVAYLLLLLGIYGILFELINPGYVAPGVIGATAMLIALYAFQLLPINYAGLGLVLLGIGFIVAEVFTPSFGILGIGGTVAFIVGSVFLLDSNYPAYRIALSAIYAMAAANLLIFMTLISMAWRAKKGKMLHGLALMDGKVGQTLTPVHDSGQAVFKGEIWEVHSDLPLEKGVKVKVIEVEGLKLKVIAI